MGPYDPPQVIKTEVVAVLPERFAQSGSRHGNVTSRYARPQVGVDFYLEGPRSIAKAASTSPTCRTAGSSAWTRPARSSWPPSTTASRTG